MLNISCPVIKYSNKYYINSIAMLVQIKHLIFNVNIFYKLKKILFSIIFQRRIIPNNLYILCLKLLYEEYMTTPPKQTDSEKKHCVTAAYHTWASNNLSQSGLMKKMIPFTAPSRVTALTNKLIIMM